MAKHLIKKLKLIDVAAEDHQAHRERSCQDQGLSTRLIARIKAMFSSDNQKANDSKKGRPKPPNRIKLPICNTPRRSRDPRSWLLS